MPRPQPLKNLASALPHPEGNALTPRTPHSRTARLEGGFASLQISDADDFENDLFMSQQQLAPLLASSQTARFTAGLRPSASGDIALSSPSREPLSPLSRVLFSFGVGLACILLVLIAISFKRPDFLQNLIGSEDHATEIQSGDSAIYTTFPLSGVGYLRECQKKMPGYMAHGDYWDNFHGSADIGHASDPHNRICNSTITYMLDGNVGLTADLALMAQAAALARERNRTFFVDDTHWTRGKWSDYFEDPTHLQPGPEPGCLRPPPQELVACPRTTRHWIINSLTAKYHFGHDFENHYENPYEHQLNRAKPIFGFAEQSFTSTLRPTSAMTELINAAKQELRQIQPMGVENDLLIIDEHSTAEITYISVHIRRGDRVPHGWEHHKKPIPLKEYVDPVMNITRAVTPSKPIVVYLASDSPAEIQAFVKAYGGPTFSLATSTNPVLKTLASPGEYFQARFNALPLKERQQATKGAIVDLALVTGLWDSGLEPHLHSVVCTVSSSFGRLAAIGLGWDKAFGGVNRMGELNEETKRWVDVDLKGHELPVWTAFEMF